MANDTDGVKELCRCGQPPGTCSSCSGSRFTIGGTHGVPGTPAPMFAVGVARRKWESLQAEGYRMQRIHFARSVDGQERRGSIDPWGKVLWEPDGVNGLDGGQQK
jgi:hypothetical protein